MYLDRISTTTAVDPCKADSSKYIFSSLTASFKAAFKTIVSQNVEAVSATGIVYSALRIVSLNILSPWYACPSSCAKVTTSPNEPLKFDSIRDSLIGLILAQKAPPTFPL